MHPHPATCTPVGIFDSGLGGLSILRHVRRLLPQEDVLYFADSDYAPYGGRPESEILARTLAIGEFLVGQGCKALVVACNTATAAAITTLRARFPGLPVVGVEPGIKPAAVLTRSGVVGVLATERTVGSARFVGLRAQLEATTGVRFIVQACPGLADQIEKAELHSATTARMLQGFLQPLLNEGADTLVLGCTHYPFLTPLIDKLCRSGAATEVQIVDTGAAVARQLHNVLAGERLLRGRETPERNRAGTLSGYTSGSAASLETALQRLLHETVAVCAVHAR